MSISLCFNDFTFSPITRGNQPWIRATELARALGYGRENQVSRLYRNNADEFTPDMTQVVEITAQTHNGAEGRARIFSLRGCHLLAMFARTPVAKAFRKWVLDVIEQYGDRVPVESPVTVGDTTMTADRPSRRTDPERKQLTAIINTWVGMAPIHYASARAQVNAHFGVASVDSLTIGQVREAIRWVQDKIDVLTCAHIPQPGRPPLYRNGCFYPPHVNRAHVPGPEETALMALWKDWPRREKALSDAFAALLNEIRRHQGDSFSYLVSDMGRDADTLFSTACLMDGLYCAHASAMDNFRRALEMARLHLRLAANVAVIQGR